MRFLYGQNGLVGFIIDGLTYTYRKNLFGDIIGIFSGNTEMATYVYDAWGNCTITKNTNGLGTLNPFRYRGYYWDSNLGLYYLISRYYDPQTGRFINSDSLDYLDPETLGGLNLYAYCGNNPVMGVDPEGHALLSIIISIILILAGGAIGGTVRGVQAKAEGKQGWDLAKEILTGIAIGLSAAGGVVAFAGAGAFVAGSLLGLKVFAIGALGANLVSFVIAPLLGIETPSIEYEAPAQINDPYRTPERAPNWQQ